MRSWGDCAALNLLTRAHAVADRACDVGEVVINGALKVMDQRWAPLARSDPAPRAGHILPTQGFRPSRLSFGILGERAGLGTGAMTGIGWLGCRSVFDAMNSPTRRGSSDLAARIVDSMPVLGLERIFKGITHLADVVNLSTPGAERATGLTRARQQFIGFAPHGQKSVGALRGLTDGTRRHMSAST